MICSFFHQLFNGVKTKRSNMNDANSKSENYLKISSDQCLQELIWDEKNKKFSIKKNDVDDQNEDHGVNDQNKDKKIEDLRKEIEPWLTALFQSEQLNLLIGNGLILSLQDMANSQNGENSKNTMKTTPFKMFSQELEKATEELAKENGRKESNIEDQLNVAQNLLHGLKIYTQDQNKNNEKLKQEKVKLKEDTEKLEKEINKKLREFINEILKVENNILGEQENKENQEKTNKHKESKEWLVRFLMSFASRVASRERLHIFTTNYDRVIEWGADLTGLRLIDRFVGSMEPILRTSRLNIDMHYNPPGIRGEPRYLEGVAYFTKLHGSLDWRYKNQEVQRVALPFGQKDTSITQEGQCLIYPHSAKDLQTTNYPYSELFRDFAMAVCRPNTTLVTYGYGFGDKHINRIIKDMLTIPSTHLVMISYEWNDTVLNFFNDSSRKEQISVLAGPQLANLKDLVNHYLPKSAIDLSMKRMFEILKTRDVSNENKVQNKKDASSKNGKV